MTDSLPSPLVSVCIPPAIRSQAEKLASEDPPIHPAWNKIEQRGKHFVLRTSSIEDIEEIADWAYCWLMEPDERLDKAKRQAFQSVIARAGRYVHLKPLGSCHYIATGWKQR